jgi:hypothetical protein
MCNKKSLIKFLVCFFLICRVADAQGTDPQQNEEEKPQDGFVRVINAATVMMQEPWRSGVDLAFKDQVLAVDMRGGEGATYRKITSVGRDRLEVISTGSKKSLVSIPATFNKGAFYTIVVSGPMRDTTSSLKPFIIKDYPLAEEKQSLLKTSALVRIFNGVGTFPVRLQIETGFSEVLNPLGSREIQLPSGTHQYRLLFPYKDSQREMRGVFMVNAGSLYTAIVYASPEKPDRPVMRIWNDSEQISDAMEAEAEDEQEEE